MADDSADLRPCARCGARRPVTAFPERRLGSGKRYGHCRDCKAAYQKAWYEKNKERHKANVATLRRERVREHQRIVREAKDVPCADCGVLYPPYVMDFDHGDEDKVGNIALLVSTATTATLLAEIAKCDVVCANCHRERTYGPGDSAWRRRRRPYSGTPSNSGSEAVDDSGEHRQLRWAFERRVRYRAR